jgi:hypothetical protein
MSWRILPRILKCVGFNFSTTDNDLPFPKVHHLVDFIRYVTSGFGGWEHVEK